MSAPMGQQGLPQDPEEGRKAVWGREGARQTEVGGAQPEAHPELLSPAGPGTPGPSEGGRGRLEKLRHCQAPPAALGLPIPKG